MYTQTYYQTTKRIIRDKSMDFWGDTLQIFFVCELLTSFIPALKMFNIGASLHFYILTLPYRWASLMHDACVYVAMPHDFVTSLTDK